MSFERKDAPLDSMLAIKDGSNWVNGYEDDVASHLEFWAQQAAATTPNFACDLVSDLHATLAETNTTIALANRNTQWPYAVSEHDKRAIRDRALGAVGMSLLARSCPLFRTLEPTTGLLSFGLKLESEKSKPDNPVLHDMDEDDFGMPIRYAFHVSAKEADQYFPLEQHPDQWFKQGDLWVYRIPSVKRGTKLILRVINQDIRVNFSQMITLVPYVASKTPAR